MINNFLLIYILKDGTQQLGGVVVVVASVLHPPLIFQDDFRFVMSIKNGNFIIIGLTRCKGGGLHVVIVLILS